MITDHRTRRYRDYCAQDQEIQRLLIIGLEDTEITDHRTGDTKITVHRTRIFREYWPLYQQLQSLNISFNDCQLTLFSFHYGFPILSLLLNHPKTDIDEANLEAKANILKED